MNVIDKLDQFRRHPDWTKAFHAAEKKCAHLFELYEGRRCISEDNAKILIDTADQLFIDQIIKDGG